MTSAAERPPRDAFTVLNVRYVGGGAQRAERGDDGGGVGHVDELHVRDALHQAVHHLSGADLDEGRNAALGHEAYRLEPFHALRQVPDERVRDQRAALVGCPAPVPRPRPHRVPAREGPT